MTVARKLSDFLTSAAPADLPEQALRHAAMIIASTIASAACGAGVPLCSDHWRAGRGARGPPRRIALV